MDIFDAVMESYPHYFLLFPPDSYGTQICCLEMTSTWVCALSARLSKQSFDLASPSADRNLLSRLVSAGDAHAKGLRWKQYALLMTAARYVWAQMDTYTVGRVPLGSTSTRRFLSSDHFDHLI